MKENLMKNITYFSYVTCVGSEEAYIDENRNWWKFSAFNFGGFIWSKLLVNIPHLEPTAGRKHQANGHNPNHSHQSQHNALALLLIRTQQVDYATTRCIFSTGTL